MEENNKEEILMFKIKSLILEGEIKDIEIKELKRSVHTFLSMCAALLSAVVLSIIYFGMLNLIFEIIKIIIVMIFTFIVFFKNKDNDGRE